MIGSDQTLAMPMIGSDHGMVESSNDERSNFGLVVMF